VSFPFFFLEMATPDAPRVLSLSLVLPIRLSITDRRTNHPTPLSLAGETGPSFTFISGGAFPSFISQLLPRLTDELSAKQVAIHRTKGLFPSLHARSLSFSGERLALSITSHCFALAASTRALVHSAVAEAGEGEEEASQKGLSVSGKRERGLVSAPLDPPKCEGKSCFRFPLPSLWRSSPFTGPF